MPQNSFLTISQIAQELNAGRATIKFILKRFEKWIPGEIREGQSIYSSRLIQTISDTMEKLDIGILPSQIEKELEQRAPANDAADGSLKENDIRLSRNGFDLLTSLFTDIGAQQKRIAKAHEKRAEAEERKAVAIEKRAEAEEKKARAMNNIANALQEMNRLRGVAGPAEQIAHRAVSALTGSEIETNTHSPENAVPSAPDTVDADDTLDDLAVLLQDIDTSEDLVLSKDIPPAEDHSQENGGLSTGDENTRLLELDDLSSLIDAGDIVSKKPVEADSDEDLDDLYTLIKDTTGLDGAGASSSHKLDDLSKLIDSVSEPSDGVATPDDITVPAEEIKLDDLSELIDHEQQETADTSIEMDDLSLLVSDMDSPLPAPADTNEPLDSDGMDDLSLLIEPGQESSGDTLPASSDSEPLDDLSALIDPLGAAPAEAEETRAVTPPAPAVTIDFSPSDDIEKYKAEIMKLIIGFKKDGMDAQQVTDLFNENQVKTLSGKPEWSLKAIAQIFKFIESVG